MAVSIMVLVVMVVVVVVVVVIVVVEVVVLVQYYKKCDHYLIRLIVASVKDRQSLLVPEETNQPEEKGKKIIYIYIKDEWRPLERIPKTAADFYTEELKQHYMFLLKKKMTNTLNTRIIRTNAIFFQTSLTCSWSVIWESIVKEPNRQND